MNPGNVTFKYSGNIFTDVLMHIMALTVYRGSHARIRSES